MFERILTIILDEGKWLPASMGLAVLAAGLFLWRYRARGFSDPRLVAGAMSLFAGLMIGNMAFGHLLAISIKLLRGDLEGPVPLLYLIGLVLAAPSAWLAWRAPDLPQATHRDDKRLVAPNLSLAATLLLLGPHNLPLALPAICNIAHQYCLGRKLGWVIVGVAVLLNGSLFVGALVFMASGQTFEQFSGRG